MKRSIFKIVTCVAACAAVATLHGQPNTDKLSSEIGKDVLEQNQKLRSANGQYELVMQSDGHLCIYKNGQFFWGNGSYGKGAPPYRLKMRSDSSLVVSGSTGEIWSSDVRSNWKRPYTVFMQDDGNLAIYDKTHSNIWSWMYPNYVPITAPDLSFELLTISNSPFLGTFAPFNPDPGIVNETRYEFVTASGLSQTLIVDPGTDSKFEISGRTLKYNKMHTSAPNYEVRVAAIYRHYRNEQTVRIR